MRAEEQFKLAYMAIAYLKGQNAKLVDAIAALERRLAESHGRDRRMVEEFYRGDDRRHEDGSGEGDSKPEGVSGEGTGGFAQCNPRPHQPDICPRRQWQGQCWKAMKWGYPTTSANRA